MNSVKQITSNFLIGSGVGGWILILNNKLKNNKISIDNNIKYIKNKQNELK